jgi:hypothetical protein
MRFRFRIQCCLLAIILFGWVGLAAAQTGVTNSAGLWSLITMRAAAASGAPISTAPFALAPEKYAHFALNESLMQSKLVGAQTAARSASSPPLLLDVPLPTGAMVSLVVEESSTMEPGLAAQFPQIRTYSATSSDPRILSGKLDFTEQGFHAMLMTDQGVVMVDPRSDAAGNRSYISYYKQDYNPADKDRSGMVCTAPDAHAGKMSVAHDAAGSRRIGLRSGSQLTTYRLAMAATPEYTQFQGGTVAKALSAIVTTVNRVNSIYERDFAVHLTLINNTSSVIYTTTSPYTNSDGGAMLDQNQTNLDAVIGDANYDIGHVVSTGGGGVANLQVPCSTGMKARGVTGSPQPVGDPFDIDYVAHEMGHQFGGTHTFNATTGSCGGGNREATTAYEPGSGTTIMAYAGICGGENLQSNSDSLFNAASITQIVNFLTIGGGATCGVRTPLNNTAPVANAGTSYNVPANTPFVLTGSGSDVNGDTLSYAWDEMDLGTASTRTDMGDEGTRPLFRSFVPSTSVQRFFPKLSSVLSSTPNIGERLPTTTRKLNFRLTVRDQKGGVADSDVQLNVTAAAGPFAITAPVAGQALGNTALVTWNVANTTTAPVSCSQVDIGLSTDSGASFPTTLLTRAPNNGSATVTLPAGSSSTARFKVQCSNNVFFDVSRSDLSYVSTASTCTYALGTNSATVAANASTGSVNVIAANACAWTAVSNAAWLTIVSGASGSANGSVSYAVAANTNTSPRTGTLTVAGQTFTVTQSAGSCSFVLGAPSASVAAGASVSNVTVTAGSGCAWTATSNVSWLSISSGASATGSGSVTYAVAANTSSQSRTGTLTIAGQTFTVTQAGASGCSYSLSRSSITTAAASSNFSVGITTASGCAWTAASNVPWLTFTSAANGVGSATVTLQVAASTSTSTRIGNLSIAGVTLQVTQSAINSFTSTTGNDNFVGISGAINTGVFAGNTSQYAVSLNGSGVIQVSDSVSGRDGTDTLTGIQRLQFADQNMAFDLNGPGSAGGIYRLYAAAFNRAPDLPGLGYWILQADLGQSAISIAAGFVYSKEFQTLYNVTMTDSFGTGLNVNNLVNGFYLNILHRQPDPGGLAYYVGQITTHAKSIGQVLAELSDSPENYAQVAAQIANGIVYVPWHN